MIVGMNFQNTERLKLIEMNFVCVGIRFLFFDGKNRYTVEYAYGLSKWYVFEEQKRTDALFIKDRTHPKSKSPNRDLAEEVLYEYLKTEPWMQ